MLDALRKSPYWGVRPHLFLSGGWQTLEEKKLEGADDKKNKKFNKYVKSNDKGKADPKGTPGQLRYRIEESEKLELAQPKLQTQAEQDQSQYQACRPGVSP